VNNVDLVSAIKSVLELRRSVYKIFVQLGNVELLYEKLDPLELLLNKVV
jgi:hypothetical protein